MCARGTLCGMAVLEHALGSPAEACVRLTASEQGLSHDEVVRRTATYGPNSLPNRDRTSGTILLHQVRSPFMYILAGAALLSVFLGEPADALLILLFICINTAIGFFQEYRSEQTLRLLRQYAAARARVRRDGQVAVCLARDLVPGDIVVLETGDRVPADVRLLHTHGLTVDESVCTGESGSAPKQSAACPAVPGGLYEASNLCFAGTTVTGGSAEGLVVATGAASTLGQLAAHSSERQSSFEQHLTQFSAFILRLVVGTIALVFLLHLVLKGGATDIPTLLLFSVALAVGVIPEALPLVTTFCFSRSARRLARQHVVVRRLSAVEDLGSIEVLATDKTGTITENHLTVSDTWGDPGHVRYLGNVGADTARTDPFDTALWEATPQSERAAVENAEVRATVPFDPRTRYNAVVVAENGRLRLVLRGAPDTVADCTTLQGQEREALAAWCAEAGTRGMRTLAVADRYLDDGEDPFTAAAAPRGLTFGGAVTFRDPIKHSTYHAVTEARALGVRIVMITGDAPEVARAVGTELGLISAADRVVTGAWFASLTRDEQREVVLTHQVFARIAPEQKHDIVALLSERHAVGFLGEGINDVPALRTASVSLVVESASDIARDAADIILLEKSLGAVVQGIREGRTAVVNTSTYIKATLGSSFGNFYTVALVSLFLAYLPMLPMQILLLNLLSDAPMIAIAADTVGRSALKRPGGRTMRDILLAATIFGAVSTFFDFIMFGLFAQEPASVLQTNWFIGSALTELAFLFAIRTNGPFFRGEHVPKSILFLTGVAAVATLLVPYLPVTSRLFHFAPPSPTHLALIAAVVVGYFAATEATKRLYQRYLAHTPPAHLRHG